MIFMSSWTSSLSHFSLSLIFLRSLSLALYNEWLTDASIDITSRRLPHRTCDGLCPMPQLCLHLLWIVTYAHNYMIRILILTST